MGDIIVEVCQKEPTNCENGISEEQKHDENAEESENCVCFSSKTDKSSPAPCRKNHCAQSPSSAANYRRKLGDRKSKSPADRKPIKLETDIVDSDEKREDLCDETIVDGFAFLAFRSHQDMEVNFDIFG